MVRSGGCWWLIVSSLVVVLLVSGGAGRVASADERIGDYHADIEVHEDGSLRVTETIQVTVEHRKINRGIYRDFPTVYKTKWFVKTQVPFDVESVTLDGHPEPYHTERVSNGIRVYIGQKDVLVPRGEHTYTIAYTTDFQIGYFDKFDELYWNVTGNGWEFPIARATASVKLPAGVPLDEVQPEGYTGPQGSKATNLTAEVNRATGTIDFATTRPLGFHEGLTIVVRFPKGFVHEPTAAERRSMFFRSNLTLWVMLAALSVLLGYHVVAWVAVGRDPPGGVIIPQFEPPLDLPPACARYLVRMGYDRKCFTAAVINAAVKGQVTIQEDGGEYSMRRRDDGQPEKLSPGEKAVITTLLPAGAGSITFKQTNHAKIKKAIEKLGNWLSREFDGKLFLKNRWWLVPGWALAALGVAAVALSSGWQGLPIVGFLSIWLTVWTIVCLGLAMGVASAWRGARAIRTGTMKRVGSYGSALVLTAFAIPFFAGELVGLGFLAFGASPWIIPMLAGAATILWAFWYLIKQPTVEGRRVMDEIEGFRMYLGTAEKEYLDKMHPPEQTPELFEKYLPYALALDVENEWSEKFADVLAKAATESGESYRPAWYYGSGWNSTAPAAFASGLGSSLGSAIASSSTAPGSSSGGGGGGFSGGGGGGGGGGGW